MRNKARPDLDRLSLDELIEWIRRNMPDDIDPLDPMEWFLHAYGSHYLNEDDTLPKWGELQFHGELLQNVYDHLV